MAKCSFEIDYPSFRIMNWLILALLSSFFFSLYSLLARVLSVKSKDPRAFSLVYNLICSVIVLILWLIEGESLRTIDIRIFLMTFVAITLWGLFNRVEFYSQKYMESSLRTIISKTSELVTFLAAIILLGESITLKKVLAVILILGACVIVLLKKSKKLNKKGLVYTLLTSVFLGLAWTMDKQVSGYYHISFYVLLTYSLSSIYIVFFPTIPLKAIRDEFKQANWKVIILAIINVMAYYTLVSAFSVGEASKVILILASRSVFVILAGIFILKEKSDVRKKIIAGVLVTLGILLLK